MLDFSLRRLSGRSFLSQFFTRGMVRQPADYLPFHPSFLTKNKALGVILALLFTLFPSTSLMAASTHNKKVIPKEIAESFEDFQEGKSVSAHSQDLCAWERDLGFFLSQSKEQEKSERIDCALRLKSEDPATQIGEMKDEFKPEDEQLVDELNVLVAGFPIETMTKAIAQYDREIAGLIVGIGKKESNWGKRTPKQNGDECFNFWGYRGMGTRGMTKDGYGCWDTPEEAVKTIGDRLERLRDLRSSTEPARMVVWKCGNTCAGHSDESVRKWIADVNFYYREIAQK